MNFRALNKKINDLLGMITDCYTHLFITLHNTTAIKCSTLSKVIKKKLSHRLQNKWLI